MCFEAAMRRVSSVLIALSCMVGLVVCANSLSNSHPMNIRHVVWRNALIPGWPCRAQGNVKLNNYGVDVKRSGYGLKTSALPKHRSTAIC